MPGIEVTGAGVLRLQRIETDRLADEDVCLCRWGELSGRRRRCFSKYCTPGTGAQRLPRRNVAAVRDSTDFGSRQHPQAGCSVVNEALGTPETSSSLSTVFIGEKETSRHFMIKLIRCAATYRLVEFVGPDKQGGYPVWT